MASNVYDQELDFTWVEPEHHPSHAANGVPEAPTHWHPPAFTCNRRLPSRRHAIIVGITGAFDFFGTSKMWDETGLYRCRELSPNHANALAIYSDWCAVGQDLHGAVDDFERTELEKVSL